MTLRSLENRVIVVTGASRGIGYFAALEMARRGAHVIAIARTVGGLEELDDAITNEGGTATLVPMDITDFDAIDRLGGEISKRWGKLDGLFANAAILGDITPLGHVDTKQFEKLFAINVTANWRFIRSFDTLFKAADKARLLLVTSGVTRSFKPFFGPYTMSKIALEAMGRTYAGECANTNIRVNMFDPNIVRTAMRAKAAPGEDPQTIPHPSELAPAIAALLGDDVDENGRVYDYQAKGFLK